MSPRQSESKQPDFWNSPKVTTEENNGSLAKNPSQLSNSTIKSSKTQSHEFGIQKYWWLIPVLGIIIAIAGVTYVRLRGTNTEETTTTEITPLSVRTIQAVREPIQN